MVKASNAHIGAHRRWMGFAAGRAGRQACAFVCAPHQITAAGECRHAGRGLAARQVVTFLLV
jgi:hypothetical protein